MNDAQNRKSHALAAFDRLIDIIDTLRSPDGCPWDREQTPSSLKPYILEEACEVLDAIDTAQPEPLQEELGDLLLQILLQSQIAFESRQFHIGDVINGLSDKMIRRHPHVFSNTTVENATEVLSQWEQIKAEEKSNRGLFDGIPNSLPALLRAHRMGQKAARVGFDWPDTVSVKAKVDEEREELDHALLSGTRDEQVHEAGDLLFAITQWLRHLDIDPEDALKQCCHRFRSRFDRLQSMLRENDRTTADCDIDELEMYWQKVKQQESRHG